VDPVREQRLLNVGGIIVLSVAVAGVITGTRPPVAHAPAAAAEHDAPVERAVSYAGLRGARRGPNADMYDDVFGWLSGLPGDQRDPSLQSQADRNLALAARAERRAYAGAPPVIPHQVQDRQASACLACHANGASIGKLVAPQMSHAKLTICTQCHAVAAETAPKMALAPVGDDNEFTGASEPGNGSRAWEGAPPTIPHAVRMRENCASCHGPRGQFGLKTPHPQQVSCRQCHAPAADFDQAAPPGLPPGLPSKEP